MSKFCYQIPASLPGDLHTVCAEETHAKCTQDAQHLAGLTKWKTLRLSLRTWFLKVPHFTSTVPHILLTYLPLIYLFTEPLVPTLFCLFSTVVEQAHPRYDYSNESMALSDFSY